MVKASWGGGGRGMRMVHSPGDLEEAVEAGRREAKAAFGNDEVFVERLVERAWHIEVQVLADRQGNVVHLLRARLHGAAAPPEGGGDRAVAAPRPGRAGRHLRRRRAPDAGGPLRQRAGTVEFLMDADTGDFFFIEVNPRIQVEHTVTEVVTGIDIVKAQIADLPGGGDRHPGDRRPAAGGDRGARLGDAVPHHDRGSGEPLHPRLRAHQRLPRGQRHRHPARRRHGVLVGASSLPFYDSLLVKVTAWAALPRGVHPAHGASASRVSRPRREDEPPVPYQALITHRRSWPGTTRPRFIDETPELFRFRRAQRPRDAAACVHRRRDRRTAIRRPWPAGAHDTAGPSNPRGGAASRSPSGSRDTLQELGPAEVRLWVRAQERLLVTDTTFRDAHQSLLATRLRTYDLLEIAAYYARQLCRPVLAGDMGRRDLRHGDALPEGVALGPPRPAARGRAQRALPDAAARLERGRLHELSGQRGAPSCARRRTPASISSASSTPQRARQPARRDRRGPRVRHALRGGNLLHGRPPRPVARQVQPRLLRRTWRRQLEDAGAAPARRSRTWPACASPRPRRMLVPRCSEESGPADSLPHPRHRRRADRVVLLAADEGVDIVDCAMAPWPA